MKRQFYHEPTFNLQHFECVGKMNETYKFATEHGKGEMKGAERGIGAAANRFL